MNGQTALRRLQNHANLPASGSEQESFVLALFLADRDAKPPTLSALSDDVLRCLVVINKGLNASKSISGDGFRSAAYAIAAILSGSLEYTRRWRDEGRFQDSVLRDLELRAWRIAAAWEQVLAGDSSDLLNDVALEESGRFPRSVP